MKKKKKKKKKKIPIEIVLSSISLKFENDMPRIACRHKRPQAVARKAALLLRPG